MSCYKYFINIASVFVPFEANVSPIWEMVCLSFSLGRKIFFKYVIVRFAMLLYNTVLTHLKQFLVYMRTSLPISIANWWVSFYIGRKLSLSVLMKVTQCF